MVQLSIDFNSIPTVTAGVPIATLRDVIEHVETASSLPLERRRQILSAMRTLARVLHVDAGDIVATPAALRSRLENVTAMELGLTTGRWAGIRSLSIAGLREYGIDVMAGRRNGAILTYDWKTFYSELSSKKLQFGLSRFMSHCSAAGVAPDEVTLETFVEFERALKTNSLVRNAGRTYRTTIVCWNEARLDGEQVTGVEAIIPDHRLQYALEWDDFPASFREDAEAYLNKAANQDPFADDYSKSLRPDTVTVRRQQIIRIASVLVGPDFPKSNVTSLAVLVEPKNASTALRFCYDRAGGKTTSATYHYASLLKTIAVKWVRSDAETVEALEKLCKNLLPKSRGMTPKNRGRLRQFDDPKNIDALLNLPDRLLCQARTENGKWAATNAMYAIGIEILIVTAMRIKNLTGLEVERHFVSPQIGGKSMLHIVIPGEETKTGAPIERELPEDTIKRLQTYLDKYRPRLSSVPSKMLFPGAQGKKRHPSSFGGGIAKVILRETGLKMHPHLFRHAAAKFHMNKHPEDIETVRRILGHKSVETTMQFYAEMKTDVAFSRYDGVIADLRADGNARLQKPKKSNTHGVAR